jgi:enoyl-CoA hydratase/carnithine racemase
VQLSMMEPRLGMVPDLGGTKALVDLVGVSRAVEICLTARRIGAAEARELGLATTVVDRAGLDAAVDDLVRSLLDTPRDAAIATKALLQGAPGRSLDEQLSAERRAAVQRLRLLFGGPTEGGPR